MNSEIWRPRLIASIAQAYRQCWGEDAPADDFGGLDIQWITADGAITDTDARLIAKADLILPFATAGLLPESESVSILPTPEEIRRQVREEGLHRSCMSVGCQLADVTFYDDPLFEDEISREWSTLISYCMQAHSPELRAAIFNLPQAVEALSAYGARPRQRVDRTGPDGERLVSLVPTATSASNEWVEPLLDDCETVAAYADSFRRNEHVFPELFQLVALNHSHDPEDFPTAMPFHPYLWPFTIESFRQVAAIADGIRDLARSLSGDDEGDAMQMDESSYAKV